MIEREDDEDEDIEVTDLQNKGNDWGQSFIANQDRQSFAVGDQRLHPGSEINPQQGKDDMALRFNLSNVRQPSE